MRVLLMLALVCTRAYADATPPSDARPAVERTLDRTLPLHALRGPFASLEAYCAELRRKEDNLKECAVERQLPHAAVVIARYGGGQRDVVLAVDHGGWYVSERDAGRWPFLFDGNRERGSFVILGLDNKRGGGGGLRLRGVQGHWHKSEADDHDVQYCYAVELRCYVRRGEAMCTDPLPIAGRRDCGLGNEDDVAGFDATRWDWQQEIRDDADGNGVEIRRRTWRAFPTRFSGYNDWMSETAARARALAGHYRLPL